MFEGGGGELMDGKGSQGLVDRRDRVENARRMVGMRGETVHEKKHGGISELSSLNAFG